ncbi:hypothetical protein [Sorangium sp. So ce388]|uniref:hypothetical protein n=1 Tax=Sorangium sp. So ce388 TaxID=3133309 RepID=UPI003F5B09E5
MTPVASIYPHLSPAHLADAEEQFAAMRAALDERQKRDSRRCSVGLDPKSMTQHEIDEEIDALCAERSRARRFGPGLGAWDDSRLRALQQEAADRIPEALTVEEAADRLWLG